MTDNDALKEEPCSASMEEPYTYQQDNDGQWWRLPNAGIDCWNVLRHEKKEKCNPTGRTAELLAIGAFLSEITDAPALGIFRWYSYTGDGPIISLGVGEEHEWR